MLPVLSLVAHGNTGMVADRYCYLASTLVAPAAAVGAAWLHARVKHRRA